MSMTTAEEALKTILAQIEPKGLEKIAIDAALGRILAEDVIARRSNPPMDNSAMDGYAVIAQDIQSATPDNPVTLAVVEDIAAGAIATKTLRPHQAMRIMTGAPIPAGADAVLMQEDTEKNGGSILAKDKAEVGENIRLAGEDVKEGETAIPKGVPITPAHIGMMAVCGRSSVFVGQQPTVAILSTGDEVVDLDGDPTGPCIYNSNGYMLAAQIRSAGGVPHYMGIARDDEQDLLEKFSWALQCDVLVSSGGVSVGDYDLVKATLDKLGNEMVFWKVAMKPGKPLAFGKIQGKPVFGLAGNPVSSFVSFEQFVRPAIKKMMGAADLKPKTVQAKLTRTIRKKAGRLHFQSAIVAWDQGEYTVTPALEQGSGVLKSTVTANGLLVFPLEAEELKSGESVTVQLLEG